MLGKELPNEQLDLILRGHFGDGDDLTQLYRRVPILSSQDVGFEGSLLQAHIRVLSTIILAATPSPLR
jgi:hypothetical protein